MAEEQVFDSRSRSGSTRNSWRGDENVSPSRAQRPADIHVADLAGHFLEQGSWAHLKLPAIAEKEECIEIGPGRYHIRKVGDLRPL
jgi:hypothetical protein